MVIYSLTTQDFASRLLRGVNSDLLFFRLAALKSLANFTVGPLLPTLRVGYTCVFRLASPKNSGVIFSQILSCQTITLTQNYLLHSLIEALFMRT